jgi:predicted dehydrogenase
MESVPLCLVGCGGMGSRHLLGVAALDRAGMRNVELVAVCDVDGARAEQVAADAEELLGRRPAVHLSVEEAVADPQIAAFDVVTEVSSHVPVALPALRAGKHVMCEKPLGITIRACREIMAAAEESGAVLATAENYRRGPTNRLAKAVLDAGLIGDLHLMMETRIGGSDRVIITPWRHLKERGAIGLDMGVHLTDMIQYFLGEFENISGLGFIAEPVRRRPDSTRHDLAVYRDRLAAMPEEIVATGEDSLVALYRMRSGVHAQLSYIPSGPGHTYVRRTLHGRDGSMEVYRDRGGQAPVVRRADGELAGPDLLAQLPDFGLDELTTRLFGPSGGYDLPFADSDAGHLAIEVYDFAEAILTGRAPEVDGHTGMTAVAAVLGAYESGLLDRPVTMEEVLSGTVSAYQDEIDMALGLLPEAV